MIKDFWTTSLNSHTMKPRETDYGKNKILANKKLFTYVTADLAEKPD